MLPGAQDGPVRQRGRRGGRGVRLRVGGGLRGDVLLAAEDRVRRGREAVHPQAGEGVQSHAGMYVQCTPSIQSAFKDQIGISICNALEVGC